MKIFDCITYFDEPMLFDLRLNILEPYVDEFVVSEAKFTHSGQKKKINFNINNFPRFKKKITHIIVDKEPEDLIEINTKLPLNQSQLRINALKRIEKQRNEIKFFLNSKNENDWVIYSDSDEIPNLTDINFSKIKNKVVLFKQNIFFYKFNLALPSLDWFGSKACKIKDLQSFSHLRNTKSKKYPWWRVDIIFNNNKFINLKIINKGGWHFSMIKEPVDIYTKHKNDEHHDEFETTGIQINDIKNMVKKAYISYDHLADKKDQSKKWSKKNRVYLSKISDNRLPEYLIKNKIKYLNWFA